MPGEDLVCRVDGCNLGPDGGPYVTSKECGSYAARKSDLRLHLDMDHPGWSIHGREKKPTLSEKKERVETKIDRPTLGDSLSATEWQIFQSQWNRYLRAT